MKGECFHAQCNFGGFLLLASPQMRDPTFRRTAVLLQEHQHDEGACGFILDKPLNKQLWQLLPCVTDALDTEAASQIEELPVYLGGPCAAQQLIFVTLEWGLDGRAKLSCLEDLEQASLAMKRGLQVRAFLGFSGWGQGQLERELNADCWMIAPARPSLFAQSFQSAGAWSGHLLEMGPEMALMARTPENPLAN